VISTIRTHEAEGEYTRYPTSLCPNRGQERDEIELNVPESVTRPGTWAQRLQKHNGAHVHPAGHTDLFLTLALHGGSVEVGSRALRDSALHNQSPARPWCYPRNG
jgi:hypothetical protein